MSMVFGIDLDKRCVEPQKRLRRGEGYGWVVHRFPIKGGLPFRVVFDSWGIALAKAVSKPSYFAQRMGLLSKGDNAPIKFIGSTPQ